MKVEQLIKLLQYEDPNTPVFLSYSYGDHWHTVAAEEVRSVALNHVAEWSYGNCHKVLDPEDDLDVSEPTQDAIVLRG